MINNTYSFDDSSILNTYEVEIPKAYKIFVGRGKLRSKNFSELNLLIGKLNSLKIIKYRFVPSNIQDNIIKVANSLIEDEKINIHMITNLARPFRESIIDQLEQFSEAIKDNFGEIKKHDDINSIKAFFVDNKRQLKKEKNMPEDDDMRIISGYIKYHTKEEKHLITQDEHFWGYSDLILKEFGIVITEEWNCCKLIKDS